MEGENSQRFRLPNMLSTARPYQLGLVPGRGMVVNSGYAGHSNLIRPAQLQLGQQQFMPMPLMPAGTGVYQHRGVNGGNVFSVAPSNISQFNQGSVVGVHGSVLLTHTPHGIVIQRQNQVNQQRHALFPFPNQSIPFPQQNHQFCGLRQSTLAPVTASAEPRSTPFSHSQVHLHSPQGPALVGSGIVADAARRDVLLNRGSPATVPVLATMLSPRNQTQQQSQLQLNHHLNPTDNRESAQNAQFQAQLNVRNIPVNPATTDFGQQRIIVRSCSSGQRNDVVAVMSGQTNYSSRPPRVIIIKSSTPHGIKKQPPFEQLPGLNFNRTTEQPQNDNDEGNESIKLNSGSQRELAASVLGYSAEKWEAATPNPTGINPQPHRVDNLNNDKTQTRKVSRTGAATTAAAGRKRKTQSLVQVLQQANTSCENASTSVTEGGTPSGGKTRKRNPATNPKNVICRPGDLGLPPPLVEKAVLNLVPNPEPKPQNASGSTCWQPKTPIQRIIQRDMQAAYGSSVFKKHVTITLDKNLCNARGVYVFNVTVCEKDNKCSDFPPVKVQITDDYPAEIPIFLDFKSITQSISNKKIKQRFEIAVQMFKRKIRLLEEHKLKFHTLIYAWSCALRDALRFPQSFFNGKLQTKRSILDDF